MSTPTLLPWKALDRIKRGHSNGPIKVSLPDGFLDHLDDETVPDDGDVMAISGG